MMLIQLAVMVTGCAKKEIDPPYVDRLPDTLYPTSYLPAWPGSWWEYVSDKGDTTRTAASPTFVKDILAIGDTEETVYVPLYLGSPLWGNWLRLSVRGETKFIRMVTDSFPAGTSWYAGGSQASGGVLFNLTVVAKDTSVIVEGKLFAPVVILRLSSSRSGPLIGGPKQYYAKDVGLVREEEFYGNTDSVVSSRDLRQFFINH